MSSISWRERYIRSKSMVRRTIVEYNKRPELRAYLEIFLTLAAISLFGLFAIRPTLKTIGVLIREIEEKEKVYDTMGTKIKNLETAKTLYTREKDKIKLVFEAIPESPSPEKLLLQIEQLAYENEVSISALSMENITLIGEEEKQNKANAKSTESKSVSFTLGVDGDYLNLINLIHDIENLRRPVRFNSVSITSVSISDNAKLKLNLSNLESPYRSPENQNIK